MVEIEFLFTQPARDAFPDTHFGLLVGRDADLQRLGETLKPTRKETQRRLADPTPGIAENLKAFDEYFRANGHESPLLQQRAHFLKSGIPNANPILTLLLLTELRTGVLVGIQDAQAIRPPLRFDIASEHEAFAGMRQQVECRAGEPVLRDAEGIIASLFQGPDMRTRIHSESRNVAGFVFSVPGHPRSTVQTTTHELASLLAPACAAVEHAIFSTGMNE